MIVISHEGAIWSRNHIPKNQSDSLAVIIITPSPKRNCFFCFFFFAEGNFSEKKTRKSQKWWAGRWSFSFFEMVTFQFDIPSFSERHSIPGDSSRALFIPDRWRSLNPLKGSLNHPKKVTLNHQVGVFFSNEFRNLSWCNLTCAYVSNGLVKNHHLAFWCCKITIFPGPCTPKLDPPLRSVIRRDTLDSFDKVPRSNIGYVCQGLWIKRDFSEK